MPGQAAACPEKEMFMRYLKFTLSGILQSYGTSEPDSITYRNTSRMPETSAVTGLIACALGIRKDDARYGALEDALIIKNAKKEKVNSYLIDDQILSPRAFGKARGNAFFQGVNGASSKPQVQTQKEYIEDGNFTVYIGSDDEELLLTIHNAMRHPVWAYYLGRACCTPSQPIVEKEFVIKTEEEWTAEPKEKENSDVSVCA